MRWGFYYVAAVGAEVTFGALLKLPRCVNSSTAAITSAAKKMVDRTHFLWHCRNLVDGYGRRSPVGKLDCCNGGDSTTIHDAVVAIHPITMQISITNAAAQCHCLLLQLLGKTETPVQQSFESKLQQNLS